MSQEAVPKLIGYARVSTDAQTTALQLDALRAAGCTVIHEEALSGAIAKRPALSRALEDAKPGDTLVIWKLDRLGRSLPNLLDVAQQLRARGVELRSITEAFDTATPSGNLLFAVLGAVAQFERDVMRERVVAGLAAKRRRGERVGRAPALTPSQVAAARTLLEAGDSVGCVARDLRVGRSTLYRAIAAAG